jgi:hypothetical protein
MKNPEKILDAVLRATSLNKETVMGRSRIKIIVVARQLFCYYMAKDEPIIEADKLYEKIAAYIGLDRTSVYPAIRAITAMIETKDKQYYPVIQKFLNEMTKVDVLEWLSIVYPKIKALDMEMNSILIFGNNVHHHSLLIKIGEEIEDGEADVFSRFVDFGSMVWVTESYTEAKQVIKTYIYDLP